MPNREKWAKAYAERRPLLDKLRDTLLRNAEDALEGVEHIDRIAFRVKERDSFLQKAAKPQYSAPLVELEDQVAGRVITFFRDDMEFIRTRLVEWFNAVEHEVKKPENPSEFDYESDHYVFVIPAHLKPEGWNNVPQMPTTFELQVRTLFMHAWAEPQHDLGYKTAEGIDLDPDTRRELAWIAASAWGADKVLNHVAASLTQRT